MITVENVGPDGTITDTTVETSDDTTVTESVEGSLDDLAVGDEVVVIGEEDGDAYLAATITEGGGMFGAAGGSRRRDPTRRCRTRRGRLPNGAVPDGGQPPEMPDGVQPPTDAEGGGGFPGGPGGQFLSGTITEIDAGTITIETADGETTVVTTGDDTTVHVTETRSMVTYNACLRVAVSRGTLQCPPPDERGPSAAHGYCVKNSCSSSVPWSSADTTIGEAGTLTP